MRNDDPRDDRSTGPATSGGPDGLSSATPSGSSGHEADEADRRRVSILAASAEAGVADETAGLMYDIALEEGLDPTLALRLIRTGLAVEPPDEEEVSEAPVVDRYLPTWLFPAGSREQLDRERLFRFSFRRLRGLIESEDDVDAAFERFAAEPDVRRHDY